MSTAPPCAATTDPIEAARARALRVLGELQGDDVLLVAALLHELPSARLVARCEAATAEGVEGDERVNLPPTPLMTTVRASLLSTLDNLRVALRLRPRPYLGVNGHLRRARGGTS